MKDFRKQMHIAYKKTLFDIIHRYLSELGESEEEYVSDPELHLMNWINRNCLPMGDFSKEDAIKEIDAWKE
jgi:hypothetical protein